MQKQLAILALVSLGACSTASETVNSDATPLALQQSTAAYWQTSASNVRVGNLQPGVLGTHYSAQVGRTMYNCFYVRGSVTCDPVQTTTATQRNVWAL